MTATTDIPSKGVCFLYKQTSLRKLDHNPDAPENFLLYGLPQLRQRGIPVQSLGTEQLTLCQSWMAKAFRKLAWCLDGRSGNFDLAFGRRKELRSYQMLVATGNNVGLPLLFLKRTGFALPPVFLISVGLNSLLPQLKKRQIRYLSRTLPLARKIVVFSQVEKKNLIHNFSLPENLVEDLPFGVDPSYLPPFQSYLTKTPSIDILSVGADAQRDIGMLIDWARKNPGKRVHLILGQDIAREWKQIPDNVRVEVDVPLSQVFQRMRESAHAVIPVRQNDYTAGTTFLIHAVAAGLPTLVARTDAIKDIYKVEEGKGCWFYPPDDPKAFASSLNTLCDLSPEAKDKAANEGRAWVESHLNGKPLVDLMEEEFCTLINPNGTRLS